MDASLEMSGASARASDLDVFLSEYFGGRLLPDVQNAQPSSRVTSTDETRASELQAPDIETGKSPSQI